MPTTQDCQSTEYRVRLVEKQIRSGEPLFSTSSTSGVHRQASGVDKESEQDFKKEAARTESRIKYLINEDIEKY